MELLDLAFAELTRSNVDKRHPFKTCVLSTIGEQYPELRTVVNRNFSKSDSRLTFYTDRRSPKVRQISDHPDVSLLFYHPRKKLQIRICGTAHVLPDNSEIYQQAVVAISQSPSQSDYKTKLPPGSIMHGSLPKYGESLHIAVIQVELKELDILLLDRDGHQRRRYKSVADNWIEEFLVP